VHKLNPYDPNWKQEERKHPKNWKIFFPRVIRRAQGNKLYKVYFITNEKYPQRNGAQDTVRQK
jgi:hypothetical protein